ncbi:amidohydrolase family protein [Brevibacillus sp. NRS-1366]|uniref:amidohydrolase family protein n=1 Tax=Brevibacillus sp. NRS-1366 TaxID=3233899 RepID=UPI003D1D0869
MNNKPLKGSLLLRGGEVVRWIDNGWNIEKVDILIMDEKIVSIHEHASVHTEAEQTIDCTGMIVYPGLHNSHSHLLELWQRSLHEQLPLETWVPYKAYLDMMTNLQPHEVESVTRLACLELLRNGVTSVVEHMYLRPKLSTQAIQASMKALLTSGIRGWLAPAMVDLSTAEINGLNTIDLPREICDELSKKPVLPASEQLKLVEDAIKQAKTINNPMLNIIEGPGGPNFCSTSLFEGAIDLARRYDLMLHTHILETRCQRMVIKERFGRGTVQYLKELGALSPKFFAAHVIWIDQTEIEMLAESGVTVVHNPASNLRLGSGLCPVPEMRKAGVNVVLGSDGGDTSDSYAIMDQARFAAMIHRTSHDDPATWIAGEDAFTMATLNGAALLTGGKTGNLVAGNLADIVIMEKDHRFLTPGPIARKLVHAGNGTIRYVIVNGKMVIKDGRSTLFNEQNDVEVLQNLLERGMQLFPQSIAAGNKVYPVLNQLYNRSIKYNGTFQPGDFIRE